ncbi:MAG TPA: hypothetical protein VKK19_17585 [Candidatus Dormibacteraeota bacterium]|nr:hypothetical protein [Candidatus Dormibacteraeota bacterium]
MDHRLARRNRRWWRRIGIGAAVAILAFPVTVAAVGVLIGLVAAAFALVVALAVTIGPWMALGYGGYRLWRRSARNRQMQAGWSAAQPWRPPTVPPAGTSPPASSPAPPRADAAERLPAEERTQVGRIRRKAAVLIQQADRFPAGSRNLYLVQRMLDQYLPSTLDAYLALPPGASELPITPDRRTGAQVLRAQLDILEAKLDEAAEDLRQVNVDRLLANERFLEEHFGRPSQSELRLPQERDRTA